MQELKRKQDVTVVAGDFSAHSEENEKHENTSKFMGNLACGTHKQQRLVDESLDGAKRTRHSQLRTTRRAKGKAQANAATTAAMIHDEASQKSEAHMLTQTLCGPTKQSLM